MTSAVSWRSTLAKLLWLEKISTLEEEEFRGTEDGLGELIGVVGVPGCGVDVEFDAVAKVDIAILIRLL